MESKQCRPLVDSGSVRRYSAKMYARPGRKLVGNVRYERHRNRKLLREILGERSGAGIIGCEVDHRARVGSEAKTQDGCERVKLYGFRLCDIHVARTLETNNAIESWHKESSQSLLFHFVVAVFPLFSAAERFTAPSSVALGDTTSQMTKGSFKTPF